MKKRPSNEITKQILLILKEKPAKYSQLQRKTRTNYDSIKSHCKLLEDLGIISIETIAKDPANGKPSYRAMLAQRKKRSSNNMMIILSVL